MQPFMGESGNELNNMLKEAGLDPNEVLYTNVINERPEDNNFCRFLFRTLEAKDNKLSEFRGVFARPNLRDGLKLLERLIHHVQPSIIIALGNWAWWAVSDKYTIGGGSKKTKSRGYKLAKGIDTFRGSMEWTRPGLPKIPVLCTYHPAAVLRMWPWRFIAVNDLRRVRDFLRVEPAGRTWGFTPSILRHIKPEASLVEAWLEGALEASHFEITLDLETYAGRIHIMGLSHPGATRLGIPFMHVDKKGTRPYYSKEEWTRIYTLLRRFLTDPRVRLLGQNLLYDAQYLHNEFAYTPRVGFDTMVAQHLLWPALRRGLDFMASLYAKDYVYWKEERKNSLDTEDLDLGLLYNALDLDYTEEVAEELKRQLTERNLWHLYSDRMELYEILLDMMIRGVRVDQYEKSKQNLALTFTMTKLVEFMEGAIPEHLKPAGKKGSKPWYSSDTKLKELLYETFDLKPIIDKDTGEPTLNKDALKRLGYMYPEFKALFGAIALYRSARTFRSTFLAATLDPDGHWRCAYGINTETGRLNSTENVYDRGGNLANIPRDREPLTLYNAIEMMS
jgi:uracil-DNA glycosylase